MIDRSPNTDSDELKGPCQRSLQLFIILMFNSSFEEITKNIYLTPAHLKGKMQGDPAAGPESGVNPFCKN